MAGTDQTSDVGTDMPPPPPGAIPLDQHAAPHDEMPPPPPGAVPLGAEMPPPPAGATPLSTEKAAPPKASTEPPEWKEPPPAALPPQGTPQEPWEPGSKQEYEQWRDSPTPGTVKMPDGTIWTKPADFKPPEKPSGWIGTAIEAGRKGLVSGLTE